MKSAVLSLITAIAILFTGCAVTVPRAKRTAEANGMSNVNVLGLDPFSCSDSDMYFGRVVSGSINGHQQKVTVCCGWLTKGCTVRY